MFFLFKHRISIHKDSISDKIFRVLLPILSTFMDGLKEPRLFTEKFERRTWYVFKYKQRCYKKNDDQLFVISTGDRTRSKSWTATREILACIRKSFLTIRQSSTGTSKESPYLGDVNRLVDRQVLGWLGCDALHRWNKGQN